MNGIREKSTMEQKLMYYAVECRMPLNGSMELLPLCNMNCDMCYVRLSRSQMEAQGHMRTGAEWLALGREMAQAGVLFMLLTGGEPLLHPDFKEIYLGLRKLGMILTINTNATLIDEQWADFFAQHKPRRINITLYGVSSETYASQCHYPAGFERVINAVKLLRQRNVDVRLGFGATPQNQGDLFAFYELARELDCAVIVDSYMSPSVREQNKPFDQQSRLLPEEAAGADVMGMRLEYGDERFLASIPHSLEKLDAFVPGEEAPCQSECMAGRCSFTVNWQGKLRPCVLASEPEADVFEMGFASAWKQVSEAFLALRFCSKCSICALRSMCHACPVACKAETGDYMGRPEYLCRYAAEKERLLREYAEKD